MTMKRRDFFKMAVLAGGSMVIPAWSLGAAPAASRIPGARTLVLIELKGGNDGLATLVPYASPHLAQLRPRLALPRDQLLQLDENMGMPRTLEPLWPSWKAGDLAWVQGLGYPHPNRSHFRAMEIWDTASDGRQILDEGWLAGGLRLAQGREALTPDAMVLGDSDAGPLLGDGLQVITLDRVADFLELSANMEPLQARATTHALKAIVAARNETFAFGREFGKRLRDSAARQPSFPAGPLNAAMQALVQLWMADLWVPVVKLELNGFDTHVRQQERHDKLWVHLSGSLAALRQFLIDRGHWQRVAIATYSEFGRRAAENANGGTDHGKAAPHLLMGGKVRGGLHGAMPDLSSLDNGGDIAFTTDYRAYYRALSEGWLQLPTTGALDKAEGLSLFKS